eukprot:scaffold103534_cov74-Phaeocystis_antarctica.AAC.1
MEVQGQLKRRAHLVSLILVNVGVGQRCRTLDVKSSAPLPKEDEHARRSHPGSLISVHVGVGQRCRAHDVKSPASLPTMSTRNVPAGRWMRVQGMLKMQALTPNRCAHTVNSVGRWMKVQASSKYGTHVACNVTVDVAVNHTCCPCNYDQATTLQVARSRSETPLGRWKKCLGKGRRRAYRTSRVVMDIAAFKVGHSVRSDKDATALQAARAGSHASQGRWMTVHGKFKM